MASIRKLPSGHYRVRWKDLDGREFGETFTTKKRAVAKRAAVEVDVSRGVYPDPSLGQQTLGSYLEEVLAGDQLRPSTRALYEIQAKRYVIPRLGNRTLVSIRPPEVRRLYQDLVADGVGVPTVEVVHRLLSKIFTQAFRDGLILMNPASRARPPRAQRKPPRIPTEDDLHNVFQKMDQRYARMVPVAAWTGLRFGEIAALRVGRINLEAQKIEVVEAASEVRGKVTIGPPKTKAAMRTITIPEFLVDVLHTQLMSRADWNPGQMLGPDELVFASPRGGVLSRTRFRNRYWDPAVKEAGLADLDFHDLRHFAAWIAIKAGAHPKSIQARLGHASIRTTLDIYGGLFPSIEEELAERLNDMHQKGIEKPLVARMGHESDRTVSKLKPRKQKTGT